MLVSLKTAIMQRLLFLSFLLFIPGSSKPTELSTEQYLQKLISIFDRIPEQYKHRNLRELLVWRPINKWKKDLEDEIRYGKMNQTQDSLIHLALGEPYFNYGSNAFSDTLHDKSIDRFFIRLEDWGSLSLLSEIYRVESTKISYKKILRDPDCNFITGPKSITKTCFTILFEKEKIISQEELKRLKEYLDKSGFRSFPIGFKGSCLDGNYVSVFLQEQNSFIYSGASCPSELHPLKKLADQIKLLIQ
jgi:hypothetical protein